MRGIVTGTFYHPWGAAHHPAVVSCVDWENSFLPCPSHNQESEAVSDQGVSEITRPHTKINDFFFM